MNTVQTRVRFAPSPTGHLHIGSARTALYNWLYARKTGGVFVLRIEDTDAARSTRASYESIIEALEWLGLDWDEGPEKGGEFGPYLQSARQVIYHTEARTLLDRGLAYRCFCTTAELEELRAQSEGRGGETKYDGRCRNLPRDEVENRVARNMPSVVRFKMPDGETKFTDVVRGALAFDNSELDDFVIIKSDGRPTYNFAVVADDARMLITHVIRGDDHITNTPKQVLLFKALGYPLPKFAHLPMILGSDRSRLSKRHGATSVQEYRDMGYLPEGMINYLALLGWAFDDKTEFFTRQSLIEKFSLKKVSRNPAAFDTEKLNHINGEHFRRMDSGAKAALVESVLRRDGVLPADFDVEEWRATHTAAGGETGDSGRLHRLAFIINLMGNRLKVAGDAPRLLRYFFKDDYEQDPEARERHLSGSSAALTALARTIGALDPFSRDSIEKSVRELAGKLGMQAGDLIHPCRVALTGRSVSPDIFSVMHLLGKKKSIERLERAAGTLSSAPPAAGSQ